MRGILRTRKRADTHAYPPVAQKASGVRMRDVDDTPVLEFISSSAVCATGQCHPCADQAIQLQADTPPQIAGTRRYASRREICAPQLGAFFETVWFWTFGPSALALQEIHPNPFGPSGTRWSLVERGEA
ncbi:MAG: hypothetical protein R6X05_06200 [Desulfobacterales bacterium]